MTTTSLRRQSVLLVTLAFSGCSKQVEPTNTPAQSSESAAAAASEQGQLDRVAEADALAERALELFDVPGMSVAVIAHGKVVLAEGYGELERGKGERVDAQTSFAIASNTKAFTATAVGMLVADGTISWDDRVVDHLPELELWDHYLTRELRVRDLLSHRVGLSTWAGDLLWLSSNYDRKTVMARLKHLPAEYGFRERYGYCNLMFMVAGELIERKTGEKWDEFIREKILDPLGMTNLATRIGELEGRDNVAKPHILVDEAWETTPYLDLAAVGPAASFHANVDELSRWVRMQLADGEFEGKVVVPKEVILETRQPHIWLRVQEEDFLAPSRHLLGYGLGWYVADYRGELLVTHGGGMPGMTSRVLMFPGSDLGVIVLTSSETSVSNALALAIADLYLAKEGEARKDYIGAALERAQEAKASAEADKVGTTPSGDPPKGLVGHWKNPILGNALIKKVGERTWFEVPDHGGLRCQLFAAQQTNPPDPTDESTKVEALVPCKWTDPNMGISLFRLGMRGKKVRSLSFKVRPDFYDPLEYTFTR